MSRKSKIVYYPYLTVKEMAEKNGVAEASIRSFIQVNKIDRRFDVEITIINAMKEYLKKHPNASKNSLAKYLKVYGKCLSIQTIRKYWPYAIGEKNIEDLKDGINETQTLIEKLEQKIERPKIKNKKSIKEEGKQRVFSQQYSERTLMICLDEISKVYTNNYTYCRAEERPFKRTIGDLVCDDIKVDFNVYKDNVLCAVIEVKTNLDECYLKRVIQDFHNIAMSIKENGGNPSDIKYIVFCMERAMKSEKIEFYKEDFKNMTSKLLGCQLEMEIIFVTNEGRTRNLITNNPHTLNKKDIERFVEQFEYVGQLRQ